MLVILKATAKKITEAFRASLSLLQNPNTVTRFSHTTERLQCMRYSTVLPSAVSLAGISIRGGNNFSQKPRRLANGQQASRKMRLWIVQIDLVSRALMISSRSQSFFLVTLPCNSNPDVKSYESPPQIWFIKRHNPHRARWENMEMVQRTKRSRDIRYTLDLSDNDIPMHLLTFEPEHSFVEGYSLPNIPSPAFMDDNCSHGPGNSAQLCSGTMESGAAFVEGFP